MMQRLNIKNGIYNLELVENDGRSVADSLKY